MTTPVNDSTTPMTDIHDIKPVLAFGGQWPWWAWLVITLAFATAAGLIWWWRRRNRNEADTITMAPVMLPDEEAFQQLDRLAEQGSTDPKRFYFTLSAILRRYVERRYDFPAAEMTTEELLPQIQQLDLSEALAIEVKRFCRRSDPIKFANAGSNQTGMSKDLAFVREFVELTTPTTLEEDQDEPEANALSPSAFKQLPQQYPDSSNSLNPNTKH